MIKEYMYDPREGYDGYEGQSDDCMNNISDKDMQIVLDILNKPLKTCVPYGKDELIDVKNIQKAVEEYKKDNQ